MNIIQKVCNWYFARKALSYWYILIIDSVIVFLSGFFVYYLLYGGADLVGNFGNVSQELLVCLMVYVLSFMAFHTYHGVIRYSSFVDLHHVAYSTFTATLGVCLLYQLHVHTGWFLDKRVLSFESVLLLFIVATMAMWCMRVVVKSMHDSYRGSTNIQKVFIYGCMRGGLALAKSLRNEEPVRYRLRGFISIDKSFCGSWIMGEQVYYDEDSVVEVMKKYHVTALLVSPLQTEHFATRISLIDALIAANIKILVYPSGAKEWEKVTIRSCATNHSHVCCPRPCPTG